jgi:hypothetical protein
VVVNGDRPQKLMHRRAKCSLTDVLVTWLEQLVGGYVPTSTVTGQGDSYCTYSGTYIILDVYLSYSRRAGLQEMRRNHQRAAADGCDSSGFGRLSRDGREVYCNEVCKAEFDFWFLGEKGSGEGRSWSGNMFWSFRVL